MGRPVFPKRTVNQALGYRTSKTPEPVQLSLDLVPGETISSTPIYPIQHKHPLTTIIADLLRSRKR